MPEWLIALALILPLMVFSLSPLEQKLESFTDFWFESRQLGWAHMIALFLPGAVRRLSWRHALIMAAIAVGVSELETLLVEHIHRFPYSLLNLTAPLVGIAEWTIRRAHRGRGLIWTIVLTATIAFILPPVLTLLERSFELPWRSVNVSYLVYWPLVAVLTWVAIPAADRLAFAGSARGRHLAAAGMAVSVGCFALYFGTIIYRLAGYSLVHGQPFRQAYALAILQTRPESADTSLLWNAVDAADWSKRMEDWEAGGRLSSTVYPAIGGTRPRSNRRAAVVTASREAIDDSGGVRSDNLGPGASLRDRARVDAVCPAR